ncbi:DUF4030 domain-containing protein [Sediminibacillus massiliensis]|uniref:DUF4030 domain-containing protein n=1 Tax=Sediminibacillus massiliensis TaxID=1926277 RepID=UPI0009887151|nr:DUF4030 domain-containing protein [Sediminibacillus massiliensis]
MSSKWKYPEEMDNMKFGKDHQRRVLDQLNKTSVKNKRKRNFKLRLMTAVVGILLVACLAFTPEMQHVLAKIPYISQFLEQEEERMEQMDTLLKEVNLLTQKEGYQLENFHMNHDDKEMIVALNNWSEKNDEMKNSIIEILTESGFDGYDVKVIPYEEKEIKTDVTEEEMEQYQKDSQELTETLTNRLEEENFELMFPVQVQMNPTQGVYINVILPETEDRLDLVEKIMKEEGEKYIDKPKLDIRQVQKKAREQEIRWEETGAVHHIAQAMMESEEFPVTGFSYSFHPYPLQIKIKTSLESSDNDAEKVAEEIKDEINLYIESGEGTEPIRGDEFEVHVLGKDKKEID